MVMSAVIVAQMEGIRAKINMVEERIEDKKEELQRLEDALADLGSNKSDFLEKKKLCLEPEFTTQTFHGDNADNVDDVREDGVKVNFIAIPEDQISNAETEVSDQIDIVEQEISDLETEVATLEASLASLELTKSVVSN